MGIYAMVSILLHVIGSFGGKELTNTHDLDVIEEKLRAFLDRSEDFSRVWLTIVDNEDIAAVDAAYERLGELREWAEEGVEAIGDIRHDWATLEANLGFLFTDVNRKFSFVWKEVK